MDQTIINWFLGIFSGIILFLLNNFWGAIKDLQAAIVKIHDRASSMEILVAGDYVKREHLDRAMDTLVKKLDHIEAILDRKEDKRHIHIAAGGEIRRGD